MFGFVIFVAGFPRLYLSNALADVPKYLCPNNCGRKYKHRESLGKHLKYECGVPKKFRCEICNRAFAQKENFKTHMGIKHKIIM